MYRPEHDAKPLSTAPNGATLHFISTLCGGTGSRRRYSDAVMSWEYPTPDCRCSSGTLFQHLQNHRYSFPSGGMVHRRRSGDTVMMWD